MKKLLSLTFALLISGFAFGQVPNGNFENWTKESFFRLKNWGSIGKVSKVAGPSSSDAVRIETGQDSNLAAVAYIDFDTDLSNLTGGIPYTDKPAKVRVNMRYDIPAGDTGYIILAFSAVQFNVSIPISADFNRITGTQSTFTDFTFDITYFVPNLDPDSLVIGFTSGNVNSDLGVPSGYIEVSKVEFLDGSNATMTNIPNHDFSEWEDASYYSLDNWITTTDLLMAFNADTINAKRSTDRTSGNYSLYLQTIGTFGDTMSGVAGTTKEANNLEFDFDVPTFAANQKYMSLKGDWKYKPIAGDTAFVSAILYFQGSAIASARAANWTHSDTFVPFSVDFQYHQALTPDSASIIIVCSNPDGPIGTGSELWVDDLNMSLWATDIADIENENQFAYPNPANDYVTLEIPESVKAEAVALYDLNGKQVAVWTDLESKTELNISSFEKGIYILQLQSLSGVLNQKLIIE
jgi:hypothetical protein